MRRIVGGVALLCALLCSPRSAVAQDNPFTACRPDDTFRFQGNRPDPIAERPGAFRVTLIGPVEIVCNDLSLFADEVVYETDTRWIVARGNVTLQQPDLRIFADRAELDGRTRLGTFYNASGTARIGGTSPERNMFGTQEPDVMFHGEEIARIAPTTYTLRNAYFSTCVQPTPRWEFSGARGTIHLDRYALLRHAVLRVKDVPLLYLPVIYYPINKEDRSTGFLLPTYGNSTYRGSSISNAFFWAISRSQDATFYHDWFAKAGQGIGAEYRYVAAPGSQGRLNVVTQSLREDLGASSETTKRTFQLDGDINQQLPAGFRIFGGVNYFTDIASQQASQSLNTYAERRRGFHAQITGNLGRRVRLTGTARQNDLFYGLQEGQRYGTAPSIAVAVSDAPIGRSRVYYGASGEAAYLVRQNDLADPSTDRSLWRLDGGPSLRAPLSTLPYLTATGTASWRITRWQETADPGTGLNVAVPLTRQIFDLRAQVVGPVLARVFQTPGYGYANAFKHLIEPSVSIERTWPFFQDVDRVVRNDATDSLLGGVTTLRYALTNRLLARRATPGAEPGSAGARGVAREILTIELGQSYYSDARQRLSDTTYESIGSSGSGLSSFSPVQLVAVARPTDLTSGQFRMEIDPDVKNVRTLSASGTVQTPLARVTAGWSRRFVLAGVPDFSESRAYQFLDTATTFRTADNRFGGTYAFNFDVRHSTFLRQRVVAHYNAQCCGVAFDWQRTPRQLLGVASDTTFGISFTLAGIGSFSNPMGSFGGR